MLLLFVDMKFLIQFFTSNKKEKTPRRTDYKQELLLIQGREQFKSLLKKGLGVPVVFL